MKEQRIEVLLERLLRNRGLGSYIAVVESVSGGFMHKMYKVKTDRGQRN